MKKKLSLGCGEFLKKGYVNVDNSLTCKPDVRHDLNIIPYPFNDHECELIEADHVLEHLDNPFSVMKELYRISNNGAEIRIRVPHFSRGFTHAEHKSGFDITFPYYFSPSFPGGYQGVSLRLKSMKLRWFAQKYFKRKVMSKILYLAGSVLGVIFDLCANLSPSFCSRIWCFWVGGFEEIEFQFIVEKDPCALTSCMTKER